REATAIFIRGALIEEPIRAPHRFLEHNRKLSEKIETWQTRLRSAALPDVDEALFRFYSARIQDVSSVLDLNRFIKDKGGDQFLSATEQDLVGGRDLKLDSDSFPETVKVAGHPVALQYAYAPGEEHDGVTVQ